MDGMMREPTWLFVVYDTETLKPYAVSSSEDICIKTVDILGAPFDWMGINLDFQIECYRELSGNASRKLGDLVDFFMED